MKIWKFPDQVVRLAVIFFTAGVVLLVVRQQFIPRSFGKLGHYRADAVGEIASQPIRYAGTQACGDCHSEIVEKRNASYHKGLSCEVCHGPASLHANAPDETKPSIPRKRDHCSHCHDYNPSRPTGFPQINVLTHNPNKPCNNCHNPHDPTPPMVPGACGACHANITRMKAISYHTSLECETCHEAPPKHKEHPRAFLPKKPVDRSFCGTCHSPEATSPKEIPRVDLVAHGGRYLCWQCHYPHFPEAQ